MRGPKAPTTVHFMEGVDARARGETREDNPYCIRTDEHAEWSAGWAATFDLDEDDDPASDRETNGAALGEQNGS